MFPPIVGIIIKLLFDSELKIVIPIRKSNTRSGSRSFTHAPFSLTTIISQLLLFCSQYCHSKLISQKVVTEMSQAKVPQPTKGKGKASAAGRILENPVNAGVLSSVNTPAHVL